ncbi:MAG: CoA transferase subunit A [Clostridiaceae bacterium]|nr:CoA transferase subunit A [Eubacteriales bacterium]
MNKIMSAKEAIGRIRDNDVVMIGGFLQCASPEYLLAALIDESEATGLTVVSNDTGWEYLNTFRLMELGRVKKVYSTWVGGNPMTGAMYASDPSSVVLVPQGTLAEAVRAAGSGIGAFLTPTGVGTIAADGKEVVTLDGREYLLEKALYGDVALVHATKVDKFGNCYMRGSSKNFNAIMPQACKFAVVEAEEIVEIGEIDPDLVTVSGIYIDAIVAL